VSLKNQKRLKLSDEVWQRMAKFSEIIELRRLRERFLQEENKV